MRLFLAAVDFQSGADRRPICREGAHIVTFKARAGAKPVSTLANGAFAGLRLHGKGANRTPPTRCPAF
jgi:hypothetical protein